MAEEQSQRPYRASEPPLRSHARTSNNDPLAELARLIGQTDPFGEFGRDTRAVRRRAAGERTDWNAASPVLHTRRETRPIGTLHPRKGLMATVITMPAARSVSRRAPPTTMTQAMVAKHMAGSKRQPTTNPTKPTMRREVIHRVKRTIRTTHTNRIRTSSPKMSTTMKRRLRADAWGLWRLPA